MANTIDVLGDDAVADALIERTITEYIDDTISGTYGSLSDMFAGCEQLTNVELPNLEEVYQGMFTGCSSLVSVNLPKLTHVYHQCFYNCSALRQLVLPATTNVYGSAFVSCSALVSIDLGSVMYFSDGTNVYNNFKGCGALGRIIMRGNSVPMLSSNCFRVLPSTTLFYVPDDLVDSYKSATNWSRYGDRIKGISELPEE